MSAPARPSGVQKRNTSMRPPTARPPPNRAQTATPTFTARSAQHGTPRSSMAQSRGPSPARSVQGGSKRKEREYEHEGAEETNINVVVRCRGRNDREVRENSGVVVSTEGVKGKNVELSMGPSALSNKTYQFDRVFSPAADQAMIFEDVVEPILDEVLGGFNCTIFAYGQTGTGKTYTMSGDITDMQPLPDGAGIIPRVLNSLFTKIGEDQETSVKCSFIELYNEELRDLLSAEDNVKLKIYDDNSKKGTTTTLVQGMEESHIKNASKGIELVKSGSIKRQVAATKCNDLSSRSHTVFTITVYMKRTTDTGEDYISAGKLNLVDLAGSENIQRSGAENKRAAEAGLINKSLLTLGRVINALVEKSSHIPYRESKLTRLLQDSLGGRTKTCIIATLSPAKSNLEETISTLDYAFRAKNIRNKPQINQMVSKKTLLKEFTSEIEKLKSELIATRQRNGVYLTQENFEEITTESESRRILVDEQKDKIETMESNLRNKVQELFNLTNNFSTLKKENEQARLMLDGTKSVLEKTEIVLAHTKKNLSDETLLRKAHQRTESELADIGSDLLSTLGKTTGDIQGLHSKLKRRSDLQSVNRENWTSSRTRVLDTTEIVDTRVDALRLRQEELLANMSDRMNKFVTSELSELQTSQSFLEQKASAFQTSSGEVNVQTAKSRDDMNEVLEEIKSLRSDIKQNIGSGLQDLSTAAQRITAGIAGELDNFHTQLHASYLSLGREFKSIFEDVVKQLSDQQSEAARLRSEISAASTSFLTSGQESRSELDLALEAERERSKADREALLSQITSLITTNAEASERRVREHLDTANKRIKTSEATYVEANTAYNDTSASLQLQSQSLISSCVAAKETVKQKIKSDWALANTATEAIKTTTEAVHDETVQIVGNQIGHLDTSLSAFDEIVTRIRGQNESHHALHTKSLAALATSVEEIISSIGAQMNTSYSRTEALSTDIAVHASSLSASFPELGSEAEIRTLLRDLHDEIENAELEEYTATGQTPVKRDYVFPTTLPRTGDHEALLQRLRNGGRVSETWGKQKGGQVDMLAKSIGMAGDRKGNASPNKTPVWNDHVDDTGAGAGAGAAAIPALQSQAQAFTAGWSGGSGNVNGGNTGLGLGLRELDVNVHSHSLPLPCTESSTTNGDATATAAAAAAAVAKPVFKRAKTENAIPASVSTATAGIKERASGSGSGSGIAGPDGGVVGGISKSQSQSQLPMKKPVTRTRNTIAGMTDGAGQQKENIHDALGLDAGVAGVGGTIVGGRRLRGRGSN